MKGFEGEGREQNSGGDEGFGFGGTSYCWKG